MYNGVGLQTARGSGTSGYVVRNLQAQEGVEGHFERRKREREEAQAREAQEATAPATPLAADPALVEHERLRAVEVRCAELWDELEDQGLAEAEVDERVAALRAKLRHESAKTARDARWD